MVKSTDHKMRIGVTIFPPSSGCSFFSNGAHQNCAFLAMLFRAAGHDVCLINGSTIDHPEPLGLPEAVRTIPFKRMAEVVDDLNILFEAGAQIAAEDAERVHSHGGRVVAFRFGNNYSIDVERMVFDRPAGSILNGTVFDAVWTTTQHEETCSAYWEILHRCPVRILPHIWDPCFIDQMCESLIGVGITPGYMPGRAKKRVLTIEPNINALKNCVVPLLCIEAAYRERPELFDYVMVTNSIQMRNRLPFETFVGALDVARPSAPGEMPCASFEARYNVPYIFAKHGDVCVSHQAIAVPNYATMDLLWLRYPLVANVPALRDAGCSYYYDKYDAREGGKALIRAMTEHDDRYDEYNEAADMFLDSVMALNPANIAAHVKAAEALFE